MLRLDRFALVVALVGCLSQASAARAQAQRVTVASDCAAGTLDLHELLYLLRVELPAERVEVGAASGEPDSSAQPDLWLTLCADPGDIDSVSLRVAGGTAEMRRLELSGVPANARLRALALSLAEMIASTVPASPGSPTGPAAQPARGSAAPASSARSTRRLANAAPATSDEQDAPSDVRIGAGLAARAVALPSAADDPTLTYGPVIGVDVSRVHLSAMLLLGRKDTQLGAIALGSALFGVAYDVLRSDGDVGFAARLRGELGATWATAEPEAGATAHAATALAAGALFELTLTAPIGGDWAFEALLASGYARGLGALANDRRSATTHGMLVAASTALSCELP